MVQIGPSHSYVNTCIIQKVFRKRSVFFDIYIFTMNIYIMSIVALKKKTAAKYNNMSVGVAQFSINGGHRNQGWVGQTALSRSIPKTPMRGGAARGDAARSQLRRRVPHADRSGRCC